MIGSDRNQRSDGPGMRTAPSHSSGASGPHRQRGPFSTPIGGPVSMLVDTLTSFPPRCIIGAASSTPRSAGGGSKQGRAAGAATKNSSPCPGTRRSTSPRPGSIARQFPRKVQLIDPRRRLADKGHPCRLLSRQALRVCMQLPRLCLRHFWPIWPNEAIVAFARDVRSEVVRDRRRCLSDRSSSVGTAPSVGRA